MSDCDPRSFQTGRLCTALCCEPRLCDHPLQPLCHELNRWTCILDWLCFCNNLVKWASHACAHEGLARQELTKQTGIQTNKLPTSSGGRHGKVVPGRRKKGLRTGARRLQTETLGCANAQSFNTQHTTHRSTYQAHLFVSMRKFEKFVLQQLVPVKLPPGISQLIIVPCFQYFWGSLLAASQLLNCFATSFSFSDRAVEQLAAAAHLGGRVLIFAQHLRLSPRVNKLGSHSLVRFAQGSGTPGVQPPLLKGGLWPMDVECLD